MVDRRIMTIGGAERVLNGTVADKLASELRGVLIAIDDPDYDAVRKIWNGLVGKRPALIARCTGTADVVACVRFAREHELLISVRGGGHSAAGRGVCEKGLMIDLSLMKGIRVDPTRRAARAEPGLRLGEFDRETQAFGLATTLGVASDTGIAGLTPGGGYGWLDGKYGLACDNVLSVDVVTAEGQLVTASAEKNADLFWVSAALVRIWASSRLSNTSYIRSGQWSVASSYTRSLKGERPCVFSTNSLPLAQMKSARWVCSLAVRMEFRLSELPPATPGRLMRENGY